MAIKVNGRNTSTQGKVRIGTQPREPEPMPIPTPEPEPEPEQPEWLEEIQSPQASQFGYDEDEEQDYQWQDEPEDYYQEPQEQPPKRGGNKKDKRAKNKKMSREEKKQEKASRKNNKQRKKAENSTPEESYKHYMRRKVIVIVTFVLLVIALIFFGTYNTFFKHTLTAGEAATAANQYNNQTQAQQWDSGVNGYLQTNLYTLLKEDASFTSEVTGFTVDNITVEKNEQLSNDIILTFFSADITAGGTTNRVFMTLPLSVENDTFQLAGRVNMTLRHSYSADSTTQADNPLLSFDGIDKLGDESKEFKTTVENFFTLGYNSKSDISDIYTGSYELDFEGTFTGVSSCEVYADNNALGFNAYVTYEIQLSNGLRYTNCSYMEIEKNSSGKYNIKRIL
jgi:hypothetical protein